MTLRAPFLPRRLSTPLPVGLVLTLGLGMASMPAASAQETPAAEPPATVEATAPDAAGGAAAQQQPRRTRRGLPSQAQLTLGDKTIQVLYGELAIGSPDHRSFETLAEGAVFEYSASRCIKLFTDVDLRFGETSVATENLAAGYPGVYSLWLKKTAGGWRLVFNREGDVWGTMHDPAKDVAEIPLESTRLEAPQPTLAVTLTETDAGAGVLRIAWDDTAWSAAFRTE